MGGLHALMGAELLPSVFAGYFADIPVTYIETLNELNGQAAPLFSPFLSPDKLRGKLGYIDYGNQDAITHWQYTEQLIGLIGPNSLVSFDYRGTGHVIHDLSPIAKWMLSTF